MSGPEGLRAAGRALQYWQHRQQVNTHNLANVETTGFQARRVYSTLIAGGLPALGTAVDTRRGALHETGAPLDLTVTEGYLVVGAGAGEERIRSGSFALDGNGRVIDEKGRPLMAEGGALVVPPGPVEIDAGGNVTVAGEWVARLRVERDFAPSDEPVPIGAVGMTGAEFAGDPSVSPPLDEDGVRPEGLVSVRQGYLEGSNVSALDALIEMTTIQRAYDAVQGSVRTLDAALETIVNRLGRIG